MLDIIRVIKQIRILLGGDIQYVNQITVITVRLGTIVLTNILNVALSREKGAKVSTIAHIKSTINKITIFSKTDLIIYFLFKTL